MKFLWGLISMTGLVAVSYQLSGPTNEYIDYAEDVIAKTTFGKEVIKPIRKLQTVKQIKHSKFSKYKIPSRYKRLAKSPIIKKKMYRVKSPLQDSALIPIPKKPIKKKSYAGDFTEAEDDFEDDPDLEWGIDETLAKADEEKYPVDRAKEIKKEMEKRRLASVEAKERKEAQDTQPNNVEDNEEIESTPTESLFAEENDNDDEGFVGHNGIAAVNANQSSSSTSSTSSTSTGTTTTSSTTNTNVPSIAVNSHQTNDFINSEFVSEFLIKGACSHSGQKVYLLLPAVKEVNCINKKWEMTLDLSTQEEGELNFLFKHKSLPLNLKLIKDTVMPELIFDQDQDLIITSEEAKAFQISGDCIAGNEEAIGNEFDLEIACEDEEWESVLNLEDYPAGEHTIKFTYSDNAQNTAESEYTFTIPAALP